MKQSVNMKAGIYGRGERQIISYWRYLRFFFFLLIALNAFALDASERTFIWNEANALMQKARAPAEYLSAARVYQRLIDDGVRNGPLFYNIGTAMLSADRFEQAFDAFERAELYLGRQPDVERNMQIALAKKNKSRTAELPWYKMVAFWHYYLSCPQRTAVAAVAFLAFWLALVMRRMGLKRMTGILSLTSLVVLIVFTTSVAVSWQMETSARRYNLDLPLLPQPTNAPPAAAQS